MPKLERKDSKKNIKSSDESEVIETPKFRCSQTTQMIGKGTIGLGILILTFTITIFFLFVIFRFLQYIGISENIIITVIVLILLSFFIIFIGKYYLLTRCSIEND
ncbi:MAG: hypothetical protein WC934_02100 [Acidithiobacillus sp.]|jgi:hypothetical protein|uniref:hypothetical protein n=1 Tax=Acidithiobacillus sp. TaxID=1872118 RepID=UPI00355ED9DF